VQTNAYHRLTKDLPPDQFEINLDQVKQFFSELKIPVVETSAKVLHFNKENLNVFESFQELVRECRRLTKPAETKTKTVKKEKKCIIL
jgi:GTPase KRas protein